MSLPEDKILFISILITSFQKDSSRPVCPTPTETTLVYKFNKSRLALDYTTTLPWCSIMSLKSVFLLSSLDS